jgi:hypothetical protein
MSRGGVGGAWQNEKLVVFWWQEVSMAEPNDRVLIEMSPVQLAMALEEELDYVNHLGLFNHLRMAMAGLRELADLREMVAKLEKQVGNAPADSRGWRSLAFRKVKSPEPGC